MLYLLFYLLGCATPILFAMICDRLARDYQDREFARYIKESQESNEPDFY